MTVLRPRPSRVQQRRARWERLIMVVIVAGVAIVYFIATHG